jgi:hypothetical protein
VPVNYIADLPVHPDDILGEKSNPSHNLMEGVYAFGLVNNANFDNGKQTNIQLDQIYATLKKITKA